MEIRVIGTIGGGIMPSHMSLTSRYSWLTLVAFLSLLTLASGHVWGQGSQFALRFFGTGTGQQDRVRIPIDDNTGGPDASAPCDVGGGSFTIDFWLRGQIANNNSANAGGDEEFFDFSWINGNIIVDRDIFGGSDADWGISIAGGNVRFGIGRGEPPVGSDHTIEGSTNVLDNSWHHVAVVRDMPVGQLRIYVDGALDFQSSSGVAQGNISYPDAGVTGQITTWGPYIVLAAEKHDAGPSYPSFNGYMDELRIWTIARTQSQIAADMSLVVPVNAPSLVAYYRFEEGAGTSITDSSATNSPNGLLIAGTPGNGEWASYSANPNNTAPVSGGSLPPGFQRNTLTDALDEPTVLKFAPDGRLFVGERDGTIWIWQNGALLPSPLIQINAEISGGERGLVGLAVDPNFAANGYLYAYYTTTEPRNRVGRFTVAGNSANPSSELVIWQNPDLAADFHHGGCIGFGPDGYLYISTGDQFNSSNSQDLTNEHGKILRVTSTGAIPPSNPLIGTPGARPAIWAWGVRNPFRFTFDSVTGAMFVGDVGGNSDSSWDEINQGSLGANFGWPNQEGPNCFIGDCSSHTFPLWTFQHNDPTYYWSTPQASVTCGPVYRSTVFPSMYQGNLFVGDYANRWIRRLVLDGDGNVVADPVFLAAPNAGTIADLAVGPDGALYYVTVGVPWSGDPDEGALHRIAYVGGTNQPPVAMAAANPVSGQLPLMVQFSSAGSTDPDAAPSPLAYDWDFGNGDGSSQPNPLYTYNTAGQYAARLTLDDGAVQVQSAPIAITVGSPPTPTISVPPDGTLYRAGDSIFFSGFATDEGVGVLPATALSWSVVLRHAEHTHPFLGPIDDVASDTFDIPASGHSPENTYYEIQLTAVDSDGLVGSVSRAIMPVVSTLNFDTDPSGIPIFVDGEAVNTPRVYNSVSGHNHQVFAPSPFSLSGSSYTFACWSDGGAQLHTFAAPEGGGSLTATYAPPEGEQMITIGVNADDRDADYFPGAPNFGERLGNGYDANNLCVGRETGGDWQAGVQFQLPIPQGATVTSATLRVTASYDNAGFPFAVIRAYDVDNATPFSGAHAHRLDQHQAVTTANVSWAFSPWTDGLLYTSPNLSNLVQAIVNRPGWTANNYVGFVLDGSGSPTGTWRCMRNSPTGSEAELLVTYTVESSPPAGCCAPPCDDGLFCNGTESCMDGICVPGSDPCAPLVCDEGVDICVECTTDEECDDGFGCTLDSCTFGQCSNYSEDCVFDPYCATHLENTSCNCGYCDVECCAFTPTVYGNVNCMGPVDLDDILCVLAGFSNPANCREGDIAPCQGNGVVNLDDILGVLQAFAGADPCNCN